MSRWLKIVLGSIVALAVAAYGGLWLYAQRTTPLSVSLTDRAAAVANADRVIELGPEPERWPVRLFVPARTLQDVADTVIGTKYRIPFGGAGTEGPDGFLVAEIEKITFVPSDFLLRAKAEMKVTYAPVTRTPWWGGATVRFVAEADMLPVRGVNDDPGALYFRLVPTSFSPRVRWGPLNYAASELMSQVAASRLLEDFGQNLLIPLPPLKASIDLEPGLLTTQEGEFPVDGSYKMTANFEGRPVRGEISTDHLLIVSSGVWLLGGLPDASDPSLGPETTSRPSRREDNDQAALDARIAATAARLKPFERKSSEAEGHLPIAPVLDLVSGNSPPNTDSPPAGEYRGVSAVITEATGTLFRTKLASNPLAGDINLAVSPASQDFATGRLTFAPPVLQWVKGVGLTGSLDATAQGDARLRADISSSRIGRSLGAELEVAGSTRAEFPFTLGLQLVRNGAGSAIFLVPEIGCTRMAIDLLQVGNTGPLFATPWFTLQSVGVRFERNFGGVPATLPLIDSNPRYLPFPVGDPLAQGVVYPADGFAITTVPTKLVIGADGIEIALSLTARSASSAEQARFKSERETSLAKLRQDLPAELCAANPGFRLLTTPGPATGVR
ncbi:hypothetical protein [Altererythrobacter sp. Root672]|uniref:hypothetical protein n=1 Tax=Altererythrobacter sp. Root672 TaxID=1736584 RepID=UPI0006FF7569|nr:hypothetical protein [Altererythrobacter sp. Root672]KRA84278.1 hypothetical protein ASD76_09950 [Altererythrobacter sp. Root672]